MTTNSAVNVMAGFMVSAALVLAHVTGQVDLMSPSWLWLAGFVGLNLFQMGFTGFCPAKSLFRSMGMKDNNQSDSNCCS